jgi:hypothetical protein
MLTFPPIPPGNQRSVDTVNRLIRDQTLPARPDRATHIQARYTLAQSSSAELSLEGYLQHSSGINRYQLDRWFHAAWTPVGGRLSINTAYKAYRASMSESDLEYIHIQVHGKAPAVLAPRPRFANLSRSYPVVNSWFTRLKFALIKKMLIAASNWRLT